MTTEFPDPRHNPDLLAHHAAEQVLLDAWNSGRLPHAWLIGGIPGIGKATLAFRFARFVLSNGEEATGGLFGDPPPATSLYVAPSHPVFTRVASNGHADLLTIERPFDDKKGRLKTDIPVDQVRRIAPFLHLTAAEGGWRVVIVDGADRLNTNGQNAILKILEEPPRAHRAARGDRESRRAAPHDPLALPQAAAAASAGRGREPTCWGDTCRIWRKPTGRRWPVWPKAASAARSTSPRRAG